MFQVAAGAELGRDFEQLMQLMRLALRGGTEFGVSHGDRAEAGDGRDQRFLLGSEGSFGARIDQDRALCARSAERRRNQHSRGNQAAERVLIAAHGNRDGFSRRHGTLRQIGGKPNGLAIVPRPERVGQLGGFGGHGSQFEGSLPAQQNRDEARAQQQPETIGQSLNDCGYVGRSVQGTGDFRQDFGAAVLLARSFAEPGCFQQAAQLPGQDGGLGG